MKLTTRDDRIEQEHEHLSDQASFSDRSLGRDRASQEDRFRSTYQKDRDKILHTKAFRRLSHKTQVFLAPVGDHYRTRLTHTLEVSQIARTIARALGLNERSYRGYRARARSGSYAVRARGRGIDQPLSGAS